MARGTNHPRLGWIGSHCAGGSEEGVKFVDFVLGTSRRPGVISPSATHISAQSQITCMNMQKPTQFKKRRHTMILSAACVLLFFVCPQITIAQVNIMDELAGTRARLSMSCAGMVYAGMPPNEARGGRQISRHLLSALNDNLDLARRGESNTEFLMRFFDFHAQRAGFVTGQQQPQRVLDGLHRVGFLLAQLSRDEDQDALNRIAQACVMAFRSAS